MPDEPIIPFMPCFTNALEFTFITSDHINHITLIIIIYDYIMLITLSWGQKSSWNWHFFDLQRNIWDKEPSPSLQESYSIILELPILLLLSIIIEFS